jgi:hypothetical protein
VTFDNETNKYNRLVSRNSAEIAPFNTFTDDYDWRYNIKMDDNFDALDTEATFYKSTALGTRNNSSY